MSESFGQSETREIFASACDLRPEEQEPFVRRACKGREELYKDVMSLLRFDAMTESGDGISSTPAMKDPYIADHPERIDGYEIEEVIGHGGCGVVYRAHQRKPIERTVAIKLIRPGMDSNSVLRRFEFERKALERMNHPNIARVLDSGILSAGAGGVDRPYFVLELVQGEPITRFVKKEQIELYELIELLLQVCAAVQHAHSKGILHRDIKPSNVLVTRLDGKPHCKVIDFGIAKALDEAMSDTISMTAAGAMIGTPKYMSPEQIGGSDDVDIRSDVYSIGVMMYELVTGTSPLASADTSRSISAMLREIEESTPVAPSHHNRQIPRDLDWMILKAMDRDPSQRYQTVGALAEDLQRHLRDEPVVAGPPSIGYRVTKFYRRNRASVIAGIVAVVALIAGLSASIIFGLRTTQALELESEQRELAQRQTQRVQDINDFLLEDLFLSNAIENLGPQVTLVELLGSAAPTIDERFANDASMRARAHYLISQMYSNASLFEEARHHAIEALELLDELDEWTLIDRARLHGNSGMVFHTLGELDRARAAFTRHYELVSEIEPRPEDEMLIARSGLAAIYAAQEDYELAEPMLEEITVQMLQHDPVNLQSLIKTVLNRIAMLSSLERNQDRLELSAWLLEYIRVHDPEDKLGSQLIIRMHHTSALSVVGRAEEAIDSVESILVEIGERYGYESPAYASMLQNGAGISHRLGLYEQAIEYRTRSLVILEDVFGPHSYEVELAYNNLALYHEKLGNDQEYMDWRIRGLIQRIYVAGPGEDESLIGVSEIGAELLGSGTQWASRVIGEFDRVPEGHPKRGRYLANAAIALGSKSDLAEDNLYGVSADDFQAWLLDAADSLSSAHREHELRRILVHALPVLLEREGQTALAHEWRGRLLIEDE